jgi:hypothetical protein
MKSIGPHREKYGGNAVIAVMNGWLRPMQGYDWDRAVPDAGEKGGEAAKE